MFLKGKITRLSDGLRRVAGWTVGQSHGKPVSVLRTMIPIRGLAILLVVLAHSVIGMLAAEVTLAPVTSLSPDVLGLWQLASVPKSVILELCRCAVPLFLFLAGYFMLSTPRSWKAIWNSCRKFLLPLLTWSLVGWAFSWRKGAGGWSLADFLVKVVSGQAQAGYFFIVLIIQCYVLAKWLVPAMGKKPILVLAAAALIQLATHAYDYLILAGELGIIAPADWAVRIGTFPEFLFPRFLLSFSLGIWAAQSSQRFRHVIVNRFPAVVACSILAALLVVLERGMLFRQAFQLRGMTEFGATCLSWVEWKASTALWSIAALFLCFGWFQRRIPMKSFLDILGKYSFQIFLLHGMVLDVGKLALPKLFPGMRYYGFLGCTLLLAIGIAVPILVTKAIQKWMPPPVRIFLLGA